MSVCTNCHRDGPDGALFCAFCGSSIKPAADSDTTADPLIGMTVGGKYLVHRLLGRGGMGDVYKATHLTLDRPVVLKLLKKHFQSDPSLVQRFHREARAASRLSHPNSITVIDFGQTDDGTLFMAMEYLGGRGLDSLVSEEHPLTEDRVVHIGAQILAALSAAHGLGIIHRDLKPANVMIESRPDESDFVKVLDFGIAKLSESGTGGTGLTQAGVVCGTPGYMSPEQVRGEALDARSDLYAVGVILYEMITGLLPFTSTTPMGLVTKHLVEDPTPIEVRNPGVSVSAPLETLVMRALARKREDRFSSAAEMRAALLSCAPAGAGQAAGSIPAKKPTPTMGSGEMPAVDQGATPAPQLSAFDTPARAAGKLETQPSPLDAPVTGADLAPVSRRRTPIVVGAVAILFAVAAAASWGIASGRFGTESGGGEAASAVARPDPGGGAAAEGDPSAVESASTELPPLALSPEPPPEKPGDAASTSETDPEPGQSTSRRRPESDRAETHSKKGVKQIRAQLNSIKTPSASSGEGILTVLASPWAIVFIDGREVGETPREVLLGAGRYRVRATHPALGARERVISIKPGKRQIWNPSFGR